MHAMQSEDDEARGEHASIDEKNHCNYFGIFYRFGRTHAHI